MRTHRRAAAAILVCLIASAACGGAESNSSAPKSGESEPPSAGAGAQGTGRTPSSSTPSEEPTTTTALGDAGAGSGTKLVESQPPASDSPAAPAQSAAAGHGAHSHEPGRSVADIRAIVIGHRDEARACYDKALADHPGIEGDLVIDWTIDPKGNVSRISLDTARSQIMEPTVGACVVDIIKKIQFASSPGGYETRASYPFNFHSRHTSQTTAP